METHTLDIQLKSRSESQVETLIFKKAFEMTARFLRVIPLEFKDTDLMQNIGLDPAQPVKYVVITAKHTEANGALVPPKQKGDPAPFTVRLNGNAFDIPASEGIFISSGPITDLKLSTTNLIAIRADVFLAY